MRFFKAKGINRKINIRGYSEYYSHSVNSNIISIMFKNTSQTTCQEKVAQPDAQGESKEPPINVALKAKETSAVFPCHSCEKLYEEKVLVRCRVTTCDLKYCRPCLSKVYKYSKEAAKDLPTATWKCPKCKNKCPCPRYAYFFIYET